VDVGSEVPVRMPEGMAHRHQTAGFSQSADQATLC